MPVSTAKEVFDNHLPNRFKTKPDVVTKINSTYKFVLEGDGGGTWVVDLTKPGGEITNADAPAACTITMTAADFVAMMNGQLNPQMAFMGGKLKVAGDMAMALKLQALLG